MELMGYGTTTVPSVIPVVQWADVFEGYTFMEHYLLYPENWTLDGSNRIISLASLMPGGAPYYQTDSAKRPLANPTGGQGGLTGSMRFTQARADTLIRDAAFAAVTHTRAVVVKNEVLVGDIGESCTLWGTPNSGTTRDFWYLRDNASGSSGNLHGHVSGNFPTVSGSASQPMNADEYTLLTKTVAINSGAGTTTVTLGRRSQGETDITFGTPVVIASAAAIAAQVWQIGQNTDMEITGLIALQCDITSDSVARAGYNNWAFGPDSALGLS